MAIALFLLSLLATLALLGWLFILLHPARPWDLLPVAEDIQPPPDPPAWPGVCVVVPARNEAAALPQTLPALLEQDYPGALRVIVVDDRSSDGTAAAAHEIAARLNQTARLTVLAGEALPSGWMGKVWAMTQGLRAAAASPPDFVLLTDADIHHAPGSLRRLVAESHAAGLGLNSRMARLRCESPAERLLIPAFVYFFNLLYPMRRANNPADPLAAAAGGCVLLSWAAVEKMGGTLEAIRAEIIDDVNLARQVKGHGFAIRLSLSRTEVRSLRAYERLDDVWKMVRRTAFTELKYSWARLAGALAGLALLFGVPPFAIVCGILGATLQAETTTLVFALWALGKGMLALAVMRGVYAPAVRFFELPCHRAWTLPLAGALYGLMTLDSALRHARGAGVQWREAAPPP